MKIEKNYRKIDDVLEVNIYDMSEKSFYTPTDPIIEIEAIPFKKTLRNIPCDINIYIPHNDGEDFIIYMMGVSILERANVHSKDVEGRLLSQISPEFNEILYDTFYEVYKTHKTKKMRFEYYENDKLVRFANVKVIYELERIILISDLKITADAEEYDHENENRSNFIEYLSQTGSCYKINDKYSWTQGIYNILNRPRKENDEYYNIIFEQVIPEDRPIIENLLKILDEKVPKYETVFRIQTPDGIIKYLDMSFYTKFHENGEIRSSYALVKDITKSSNKEAMRPIDFILNGFKKSKKLALLIEPLNEYDYVFSEGFYSIVEEDKETYSNRRATIENIEEPEVIDSFRKLFNREIYEIDETFTYYPNGDRNNMKKCEIYIESFDSGSVTHSIGFLTDVTEDFKKQKALREANEHQKVLIKEVHHRVKNNLQVLNSFLNLEKRAYKNQPTIIIDHMQSRLSSLAILHEKTYNTEDFKNINLKNYVQDQDAQLTTLIGLRDGIEFESEVDENLNLSIEIITPLLLVIDELTMNAIKHAFPDKTRPNKKIRKVISQIDDNHAKLLLTDNGVGIKNPKEISSNLGCEIIKSLTRQLDGTIKLLPLEEGTGYELIFPITMEHTITQWELKNSRFK